MVLVCHARILRIAKKILEEEGWFIENGKLMKNGEEFTFEFLNCKSLS